MNTSTEIDKIASALAKAQSEISNPAKTKDINAMGENGRGYKATYADLAAIVDAIRPALSKNEIAFTQGCQASAGNFTVLVTKLIHSSGQWISSDLTFKPVREGPQGFGSGLTYARRYALAALCGVAPEDEDDDGNEAEGNGPAAKPARGSRKAAPPPSDAEPPPEVKQHVEELAAAATIEQIATIAIGLRAHAKGDPRAEGEIADACERVIATLDAPGIERILAQPAPDALSPMMSVKLPDGPAKVRVKNAVARRQRELREPNGGAR